MDDMERIVICKHCGMPEYYGKMRWLNGFCSCRNCYKEQYEGEQHEAYEWNDLDGSGRRPTMEEYLEQEGDGKTVMKFDLSELKILERLLEIE